MALKKTPIYLIILLKVIVLGILATSVYTHTDDALIIEKFKSNDYGELLAPVDNLIEHGTYAKSSNINHPYVGRLPGYMFPYVIFRAFLSQKSAVLLLLIFQFLLGLFSSYALYLLLRNSVKASIYLSCLGVITYTFFSFSVAWELRTYPESIALSCFIIGSYFLLKSLTNQNKKILLLSGSFFAWMFFLRGFLLLYFLPISAILFIPLLRSKNFKLISIRLLLFFMPLLVIETSWVSRNYYNTGEFIPLQDTLSYSFSQECMTEEYPFNSPYKPTILALRELIALWGGDNVHFYPNSEMGYFLSNDNLKIENHFPDYIFNDSFVPKDIHEINEHCKASFNSNLSLPERINQETLLWETISEKSNLFKASHSSMLLTASISRFKNLVLRNVTSDWPGKSFSENHLIYKIYKLLILSCYFTPILLSVLSLIFFLLKPKRINTTTIFFFLCLSILCLTFMFLVNVAEFKYFMTGWVSSLIISISFMQIALGRVHLPEDIS